MHRKSAPDAFEAASLVCGESNASISKTEVISVKSMNPLIDEIKSNRSEIIDTNLVPINK